MRACQQPYAAARRLKHSLRILCMPNFIRHEYLRRHGAHEQAQPVRLACPVQHVDRFPFIRRKKLLTLIRSGDVNPLRCEIQRRIPQRGRLPAARRPEQEDACRAAAEHQLLPERLTCAVHAPRDTDTDGRNLAHPGDFPAFVRSPSAYARTMSPGKRYVPLCDLRFIRIARVAAQCAHQLADLLLCKTRAALDVLSPEDEAHGLSPAYADFRQARGLRAIERSCLRRKRRAQAG